MDRMTPTPTPPAAAPEHVAVFAARLHGREIGDEITSAETAEAKAAGLVVIYGASDDLMELRGAIEEEINGYTGAIAAFDAEGLRSEWPDDEPVEEDSARAYFAREALPSGEVEAVWADEGQPAWTFRTDIPHATFDVMEDGEVFCRGIVFALASLPPAPEAPR